MKNRFLRLLPLMLVFLVSGAKAYDPPVAVGSEGFVNQAILQEQDRQVNALVDSYNQSFLESGVSKGLSSRSFDLEICMDAAALARHAMIIKGAAAFRRLDAVRINRFAQMDMAVGKVEGQCMAHFRRTPHITQE